jgi:hypothetical protein
LPPWSTEPTPEAESKARALVPIRMAELQDPSLRDKLELSPEQIDKLDNLHRQALAAIRPISDKFPQTPTEAEGKDLSEKLVQLRQESDQVLTPDQQDTWRAYRRASLWRRFAPAEKLLAPKLCRELRLTDEQIDELKKESGSWISACREYYDARRQDQRDEAEWFEIFYDMRKEHREEYHERLLACIAKSFTAAQRERLTQIELQQSLIADVPGVLLRELAERLRLSDDQRQGLKQLISKREAGVKLDFRAGIELLTPAQRRQFREMMGEPFDEDAD